MFEVGFSEICMVALVALLVIGPEKLPKFARMAGFWVAKSRRMMASVKQEINEELQLEELRQTLKNQNGTHEFQKILDETANDFYTIKSSVIQNHESSHLTQTHSEQDERK